MTYCMDYTKIWFTYVLQEMFGKMFIFTFAVVDSEIEVGQSN